MNLPPAPWVVLVTDRRRLAPDARTVAAEIAALQAWLEDAVAAGVDMVHLRERDLPAGALRDLVRHVVGRAAGTGTRVLVNDRADVAAAAGADGVHLPATGIPSGAARSLSRSWIVGRSVHTGDDVSVRADEDYLLFGTVFSTPSKPGIVPCGIAGLRAAVRQARVPLVAIGGMTPGRAWAVVTAGASGVAATSLFFEEGRAPGALGVQRAVRELRSGMAGAFAEAPRFDADVPSGTVAPPSSR